MTRLLRQAICQTSCGLTITLISLSLLQTHRQGSTLQDLGQHGPHGQKLQPRQPVLHGPAEETATMPCGTPLQEVGKYIKKAVFWYRPCPFFSCKATQDSVCLSS